MWAEQDVIVADEFRDGNVPAGCGIRRVIEKAVAALPGTFDKIYVRGDSALYEHEAMTFMDERAIAYAISADMSGPLKQAILALPPDHWKPASVEEGGIREWAEVHYVPDDRVYKKDHVTPRRYLAIRVRPAQADLLGSDEGVRHFCIVTNRSDPTGGSGLDIISWHRGKAGTIEHAHDVLMNELAGWALPSQKFGANAACCASTRSSTISYPPSSASAYPRNSTLPAPSGCASSSSAPSGKSSDTPEKPSSAAQGRPHACSATAPEFASAPYVPP